MQNYRAGPVGPVGAHGVPRGAGGRISEEREDEEGGATRGPGSTSTHLNFGPSQGQCGRTTRFPPLPSPSPPSVSFLLVRTSDSPLFVFFSPARAPLPHPQRAPYRIIASYRAGTHALSHAAVHFSFFLILFGTDQLTILRNPN